MAAKDALGRRGEDLAVAHIVASGLSIVERNWRCSLGEIDVIARDGDELVFVEVKTRSGVGYGHPLQAITPEKLARLRRLARQWCISHPGNGSRVRIDAVAVVAPARGTPVIEHVRGVF